MVAAAVSTLGDKGSHGNAVLGKEKEPGPSPTPGGQREKTGQTPAEKLPGFPQWHRDVLFLTKVCLVLSVCLKGTKY